MLSFTECTQAGVLKLACSRTLPFWWDDVSDFSTLETLTVQTFNQANKLLEHQQQMENLIDNYVQDVTCI